MALIQTTPLISVYGFATGQQDAASISKGLRAPMASMMAASVAMDFIGSGKRKLTPHSRPRPGPYRIMPSESD